jgi:two-component system CheB/CheR fusion protein
MHVLQIDEVSAFIDRLRGDSREVTLLIQDLLIGVTNFFRDPEAFTALEREVIPQLFRDKVADDTIRIWVPGCATGEEVYSIAILLRESAPKSHGTPKALEPYTASDKRKFVLTGPEIRISSNAAATLG